MPKSRKSARRPKHHHSVYVVYLRNPKGDGNAAYYVGMTGLATGPHLDYRVSRHGEFVNPLSEKFIPGEPLAGADRTRFLEHARVSLDRLAADKPF